MHEDPSMDEILFCWQLPSIIMKIPGDLEGMPIYLKVDKDMKEDFQYFTTLTIHQSLHNTLRVYQFFSGGTRP
jgi:hypothetical protein